MKRLTSLLTLVALTLNASILLAQHSWIPAASLNQPRQRHSATLLDDGRVLVAGGSDDFWGLAIIKTCEIYDPSTDKWTYCASMNRGRSSHTATLLPDGRVMVTGGFNGDYYAQTSCEIYDPVMDKWTMVAPMHTMRYLHRAIALNSDSIMVIGGRQGNIDGSGKMEIWAPLNECEIYSISNNLWSHAAPMNELRVECGYTLLPDGRVLVAGGNHKAEKIDIWGQPSTRTCEIYDPVMDTWTYTDSLHSRRNFVRIISLDDNTILSVGGEREKNALNECELYDVASATWTNAANMINPRLLAEALKTPTGDIVTVGGWSYLWSDQTGTTEWYGVESHQWEELPTLVDPRGWHSSTLLHTGNILAVGGTSVDRKILKSCELLEMSPAGSFDCYAVGDVPQDQGGMARVYWTAHRDDAAKATDKVVSYAIYLQDQEGGMEYTELPVGRWRQVTTVPASTQARYSAVAPAIGNSSVTNRAPSTYTVVAITVAGKRFVTAAATGESFDNVGPARVPSMSIMKASNGFTLHWPAAASSDIKHYAIYRGERPNFPLEPSTLVGTTTELSYTDQPYAQQTCFYRVRAIDHSGNPGLATPTVSSSTASSVPGATTGAEIVIGDLYPQPFASSATLSLFLPRETTVSISIYDNLSRLVTQTTPVRMSSGHQTLNLSADDLASGRYTCVVNAGGESKALPLVIQK